MNKFFSHLVLYSQSIMRCTIPHNEHHDYTRLAGIIRLPYSGPVGMKVAIATHHQLNQTHLFVLVAA